MFTDLLLLALAVSIIANPGIWLIAKLLLEDLALKFDEDEVF